MGKIEILKESKYINFNGLAPSGSVSKSSRIKIVSKGIKQLKYWRSVAMGDPTFDPPMPDSTIPNNMQGFHNKNVGWMHTYLVTTEPGMEPVVTFPSTPTHLIPSAEVEEISPQNYKVNVTNISSQLSTSVSFKLVNLTL